MTSVGNVFLKIVEFCGITEWRLFHVLKMGGHLMESNI